MISKRRYIYFAGNSVELASSFLAELRQVASEDLRIYALVERVEKIA